MMPRKKQGYTGLTRREYQQCMRDYLPRGEQCVNHILTEEIVKKIRENKERKSLAQWGRELSIPWTTLRDARNYITWSHIP